MMKSILASVALTSVLGVTLTLVPLGNPAQASDLNNSSDRFTSDLQNSCGDHGDHSDHKPKPRRGSR
ncbi:hypothetical protein [Spirulina major]|uniref:hypothetical protein n=1 Tax=Spirulina major TaxID=270636 RepID=UPI001114F65B|nr:hypothetical protein [Spirulina major]